MVIAYKYDILSGQNAEWTEESVLFNFIRILFGEYRYSVKYYERISN